MRHERAPRPLLAVVQSLGLLVAAALPMDAAAISAPPEARIQSYSISESAREIVDPWPRQALGDDGTFLRLLAAVLRDDDLTEEEKVDAFFLMFQKIGWAFTGTFTVPPGYTYAQMCSGQHLTLLRYQAALEALSYDGSG